MENSAKALSFPNWARLTRDKNNYPTWRKHIFDVLQAIGCDQAIRSDFAGLTYESDDSSSSDDDSDGIDLSRLGLQAKHSHQSSPTPSQEQHLKQFYDSLQLSARKAKKEKMKERQRRKKEKKFEEIESKWNRWLIGGLVIGVLIYLFPPLLSEGFHTMKAIVNQNYDWVFASSIVSSLGV